MNDLTPEVLLLVEDLIGEMKARDVQPDVASRALAAAASQILFMVGPKVLRLKATTNMGTFTATLVVEGQASQGINA